MASRQVEVLVIGAGPGTGRASLATLAPASRPDGASVPCPALACGGDLA